MLKRVILRITFQKRNETQENANLLFWLFFLSFYEDKGKIYLLHGTFLNVVPFWPI